MGRAITTITIVQEGHTTELHRTKEYQQDHIRKVENIMHDIADGHITVDFKLEEEN